MKKNYTSPFLRLVEVNTNIVTTSPKAADTSLIPTSEWGNAPDRSLFDEDEE